jgi:hypothetical protein
MVDSVGGPVAFFVLGVGLPAVALLLLLGFFKHRGWF